MRYGKKPSARYTTIGKDNEESEREIIIQNDREKTNVRREKHLYIFNRMYRLVHATNVTSE